MEEAREEFVTAVEFEPRNALAEFNLGCVLEQLGHADDAITPSPRHRACAQPWRTRI